MTDKDIMNGRPLVEEYDNGETLRFIGLGVGEWIETDIAVRREDYQ
jgi:hypothetical protein